jgi:nucleoside-diphosphate-sugar epimerase
MPGWPPLGFNVVDVRDVVDLHLRAMLAPQAAGQRFIAASSYLWMADIARILRGRLGAKAADVPTRQMPGFMLRLASLFDPQLRAVTPGMGRKRVFLSDKARNLLDWKPRSAEEAVVACAESLIAAGAV